jgi:hypothetical protein
MSATLAAALVASLRAWVVVNLKMCISWGSCGRDNSRTCPPVTGQALALSSCCDRDYPPGDAVGLLCFAAVGSESDNLAAVGALA